MDTFNNFLKMFSSRGKAKQNWKNLRGKIPTLVKKNREDIRKMEEARIIYRKSGQFKTFDQIMEKPNENYRIMNSIYESVIKEDIYKIKPANGEEEEDSDDGNKIKQYDGNKSLFEQLCKQPDPDNPDKFFAGPQAVKDEVDKWMKRANKKDKKDPEFTIVWNEYYNAWKMRGPFYDRRGNLIEFKTPEKGLQDMIWFPNIIKIIKQLADNIKGTTIKSDTEIIRDIMNTHKKKLFGETNRNKMDELAARVGVTLDWEWNIPSAASASASVNIHQYTSNLKIKW